MFMFWSKRAVLTRRLLKAKVRGEHETECETQEDTFSRINVTNTNNVSTSTTTTTATTIGEFGCSGQVVTNRAQQRSTSSTNRATTVANRFHQGCCGGDLSHDEDDDDRQHHHNHNQPQQQRADPNRLTRCKEFLKSLKENQLEMLVNVVESYGVDFGPCVLVVRRQSSPCRLSQTKNHTQAPGGLGLAQKQQDSMVQCNRHQRCGLAPSLHENSSRRISHRHLLRSRRHHGGSRCSRCVSCHGTSDEQRIGNRDDVNCTIDEETFVDNRDNEMNLRVVDTTKSGGNAFALEDLRQDQPAWSVGLGPSAICTGSTTSEAGGSRPERDRCRRNYCKIGRTTGIPSSRKRRDSPPTGETSGSDSGLTGPLDDPHLLSCQIWRWPDLANSSELKKLPVCHSAKDPVYICCNPYHWSRLCKPGKFILVLIFLYLFGLRSFSLLCVFKHFVSTFSSSYLDNIHVNL